MNDSAEGLRVPQVPSPLLVVRLQGGPPPGSVWRHKRTGHAYTVVANTLLENSLEPAVVYASRGEPALSFTRGRQEFVAKFSPVGVEGDGDFMTRRLTEKELRDIGDGVAACDSHGHPSANCAGWGCRTVRALLDEVRCLRAAVAKHHGQKADDRCAFDDDELYAAAGLPPADNRVGDKFAMAKNCLRFIEHRCQGGGPWKSYAELEQELADLRRPVKP